MGGTPSAMKPVELYNYGIQNEDSTLRAHVCPKVRRVYIFPTKCGLEAIKDGKGCPKNGYQPNVEYATGYGYCVPPFDIKGCVSLQFNNSAWDKMKFCSDDSTSDKGNKAARLVKAMLLNGLFPLPLPRSAQDQLPADIEIKGTDIIVHLCGGTFKIQVKCDFNGGEKKLGGTGNLYLQTAEINPLGMK